MTYQEFLASLGLSVPTNSDTAVSNYMRLLSDSKRGNMKASRFLGDAMSEVYKFKSEMISSSLEAFSSQCLC